METYIGYIKTPQDALLIFEACRLKKLKRVQRRLSTKERMQIKSGSIFAWDEREAGMRRWTDGKTWSPSRVLGSFLTYKELDTKRRPRKSITYKTNGLIKQSFSICTSANQKLHLISYYSKSDISKLSQPSLDSSLSSINIPKGLYPELNPLDTSGGHNATLHNLLDNAAYSMIDNNYMNASSNMNSPPSLSSSPSISLNDDILPSPISVYYTSPMLSSLDIPFEKLPFTEDQRQLNALKGLLRL